jgi:NADPH-dependent 2,4-dienoyl-CoA reductase/sulfur reductase-like enzyme
VTCLLIVGGSDAGISAALRARGIDPASEVSVVVADGFANYSICGLPFYLSGEVSDWHSLAHRTREEIEAQGISLHLNTLVTTIDAGNHTVRTVDRQGACHELAYDRLVIATGAEPIRPAIAGIDLPGVHVLHTMEDSFAVHDAIERRPPQTALIVGGGYIGLEMADALSRRGIAVHLVEQLPAVMPTMDTAIGDVLRVELERHGVVVTTGAAVARIEREGHRLVVYGNAGLRMSTELVIIGVGVRPATTLAQPAGVRTGERGAITVTRRMETNIPDVYAAGDCVETWHRFLQRPVYLPLGTTAHKQGRVAGENAVGGTRLFEGSLGTQVVKVFDLAAAGTGLRDRTADGFTPLTIETVVPDHKSYYPGAHDLTIRVTGDRVTGLLLGAQIVGSWQAEVAKRIDIYATALYHGMEVAHISDLDLSYTPPLGAPWDAVQVAADAWVQQAQMPLDGAGAAVAESRR